MGNCSKTATAERVIGHFINLLSGMVADAKLPVDRVNMLNGAEKKQLLEDWNNTQIDFPRGRLCASVV